MTTPTQPESNAQSIGPEHWTLREIEENYDVEFKPREQRTLQPRILEVTETVNDDIDGDGAWPK